MNSISQHPKNAVAGNLLIDAMTTTGASGFNLPASSLAKDAHVQAIKLLHSAIEHALRALAEQQSTLESFEPAKPAVSLDFSLDILERPNQNAISLKHKLHVQMLGQLARRPALSVRRFLLLMRFKRAEAYTGVRPPADAFRCELNSLSRAITAMNLPITIERTRRGIRAVFDTQLIRTNIGEAAAIAKVAAVQLSQSDFEGAAVLAGRAIAVDFDCSFATRVILQIMKLSPDCLTEELVVKAETAVARSMLHYAAAIHRLPKPAGGVHRDVVKSRCAAAAMLARLRRQWDTVGSWQVNKLPLDKTDHEYRANFRELVELIVDARGGNKIEFNRFDRNSIVTEVIERLSGRHLQNGEASKRQAQTQALTIEIFSKLVLTAWLPTPAPSKEAFQDDLCRFLKKSRIDSQKLSNRVHSRTVSLDEDLHGGPRPARRRHFKSD